MRNIPRKYRLFVGGCLLLVSGLCTASCQSIINSAGLGYGSVEETFIIAAKSGKGRWGMASHPFIRKVSDDRLAVTYWVNGDGTLIGFAPISWPVYSDDSGLSWHFGNPYQLSQGLTNEVDLFLNEGDEMSKTFNKGLFFASMELPDGRRYFHQREFGRRLGRQKGYGIRQLELGGNYEVINVEYDWGELEKTKRGDRLKVENPGIVLNDGRLLTVGYGIDHKIQKYTCYLFESTDFGETFSYVNIIATPEDAPWGRLGPCEPFMLMLENQELVVIMRTDGGGAADMGGLTSVAELLMARSPDLGESWTLSKMNVAGVMPKVIKMQDGTLALACGRPGNRIYFSHDLGYTWHHEISLLPGRRTSGYIDIMEVSPGRLLAVHDIINGSLGMLNSFTGDTFSGILGSFITTQASSPQ